MDAAPKQPLLDVLTVGEPLALFVAQQPGDLADIGSFQRFAAGAELNVATGLARLGVRVAYLSKVGEDAFGRFVRRTLYTEGIDARYLINDAQHSTGFMLKGRTDDGSDPAIEYHRRGSAASHMGLADWQWTERKVVKSCTPTKACAHRCMASASSGWATSQA